MKLKNYNVYFFFAILIGVSILAFFVIKNFIIPFIIAAVFATLFNFIYKWFLKIFKGKKGLSSVLSCFIIILVIIIPLTTVASLVVKEIQTLVVDYSVQNNSSPGVSIGGIAEKINSISILKRFGVENIIDEKALVSAIGNFSDSALDILGATYRSISHFIFVTFIMFFSLFYLFIDGDKMIKRIFAVSPLRDEYEEKLLLKFKSIIRATIKGTSLIAIIQGFLGGMLFWTAGVSSPVLLGILMTISSVIPSVGSGLIWLPVGVIMILLGNIVSGIIILIIGALLISTIDNVLRPKLVGHDTEMHPLMILFSTLGGIAVFGIAGFIVGPIIMSLFVALWDIYSLEFRQQLEEYNK